jgi:hypothetical protein
LGFMNKWWYLMLYLDATCKITAVADKIGVGVHFNPFVTWNGKVLLTFWVSGVVCKSDSFQFLPTHLPIYESWHVF